VNNNVTLSSSMLGRSAALRADKLATPPHPVTIAAATRKVEPVEQLQLTQSVRTEGQIQAQDKSQLNYAYQKATSTLSVQVVNKQTGAFIREIEFKGFNAMTYNSHGYKGNFVDQSA
jgi:hypothetical protein